MYAYAYMVVQKAVVPRF